MALVATGTGRSHGTASFTSIIMGGLGIMVMDVGFKAVLLLGEVGVMVVDLRLGFTEL